MAIVIWYLAEALAACAGESVDSHTVGQTFRDCKDYCPAMVVIPKGKFTIGSPLPKRAGAAMKILSRS